MYVEVKQLASLATLQSKHSEASKHIRESAGMLCMAIAQESSLKFASLKLNVRMISELYYCLIVALG